MNNRLARHIIETAIEAGVQEFCLAAGKRNAPFVFALAHMKEVKTYYWPEERSAAFFALGRTRATGRPVAIITTSGTAAAQLLPAAMEAYYTHHPLLLITADRPRRLRGSGAPQCAEQVGLFSYYARFMQDVAENEECQLHKWSHQGPAHLNICFDEPEEAHCMDLIHNQPKMKERRPKQHNRKKCTTDSLQDFLKHVKHPLVIVGALDTAHHEQTVDFLLRYQAPVYAEGHSGLREDPRLDHLRVGVEKIWQRSNAAGYPIDGVLRIGSIPTGRLWRDLDEMNGQMRVCSISHLPFSGLSWDAEVHPLHECFEAIISLTIPTSHQSDKWIQAEKDYDNKLVQLFHDEPNAEPSLFYHLSKLIPDYSKVYLGNSMPIREWDLAAVKESKKLQVSASRGLCGIDGQIATFLGLSTPEQGNWGIIGDLTALFDMAAPWIMDQLPDLDVNLVIVNNSGGQIFSKMFTLPHFINAHALNFEPLANFWKWKYERWTEIPQKIENHRGARLIEVIPDPEATERFYARMKTL